MNQHVLITGGARGIGHEIARQFVAQGACVHIFDFDQQLLDAAVISLAKGEAARDTTEAKIPRVAGTLVDVSDADAVAQAVAALWQAAPIDVLINNAGVAEETPFLSITPAAWRRILDINLTGMFLVAHAVAKGMADRGTGVIVNMGSKNGLLGEVGYSHYNASKGGVVMLTRTMALELAPRGVRVNCVCPGYIQTPMSQEIDAPEFVRDFVDRYIPAGRPGRVEDVAPVFLFLASDDARFIHGQTITVDGGQMAGQKPGPSWRY